ncbi:winged helix-turn-helix domain-containing protein [Sedimentitalea sp.]|uniref:winged helix-turn-helix domain-containing protein n=1 Tax=Sedimentitalea sp. TaxID=2048915 RepID=UPI003297E23F
MTYVFSDFELDTELAELRFAGQTVSIEPQVFDLLKLLVSSGNRLVSKEEIFEKIWGDRIVSDAALSGRIRDARKAIGDDGTTQKFIKTVQRRGLRFVADVKVCNSVPLANVPSEAVSNVADQTDAFARPAVAVLKFQDASGEGQPSQLEAAITDELVAALSAWKYFPVISRQSTARVNAPEMSAQEIGTLLSARYLVHGTFRRAGNRLKIHVALTDTDLNTQIWSEGLACDIDELFEVEEEIAGQIASIVSPELERAEARRVLRKPPKDMTVWELTMRAASLLSNGKRSDFVEADRLAREAAERAPDWVLPYTLIATAQFQMAMANFSSSESASAFTPTLEAARRALEIDRSAWIAHALTAVGELWTNKNHELALLHVERAIELNPSAGMNYHFGGCITGFSGNPEKARFYQERLFRIDPTYPYRAVIEADLGLWHLLDKQFDKANERLRLSQSWDPFYGRALQRRVALSGLTGDCDEAQQAARKLFEMGLPLDYRTIASSYPFLKEEHSEIFLDGLRRSGVNL